jgi:hypothetical protein
LYIGISRKWIWVWRLVGCEYVYEHYLKRVRIWISCDWICNAPAYEGEEEGYCNAHNPVRRVNVVDARERENVPRNRTGW